jgi:uncharacterized protein
MVMDGNGRDTMNSVLYMCAAKSSRTRQTAAAKADPPPEPSAFDRAMHDLRHSPGTFQNVSALWLFGALGGVLVAIVAFAWLALCLLYWQGSWQLLYHPRKDITRTPASVGLSYEPVHFATTEAGTPQLFGWWLPAAESRFTVLYLHGADGNLSETIDSLAELHRLNLSVLAFDYRGYGQSAPAWPSEKGLLQDAANAIDWLILTRHVSPGNIVVYGSELGANLALQIAASHSQLAGVILDQPVQDALQPVFGDPRSRLVPAHTLVRDRYDLMRPATALTIPSLWLISQARGRGPATPPSAYERENTAKTVVILQAPIQADPSYDAYLRRWLDDLPQK